MRSCIVVPRLKGAVWARLGDDLVVVDDPREQLLLSDPSGQVESLLELLREGSRTAEELVRALAPRGPVTLAEIEEALAALDGLGLLVDAAAGSTLSSTERERYFSNLAFFRTFASLEHSPEWFQERLSRARVVMLGAGGLGSTVLLDLAGMGVGHVTLLDCDRVELRNFARQFLYSEADIGQPKVERAAARLRAFNSGMEFTLVDRRVGGTGDLAELVTGADLVVSGIDNPDQVDLWVNEACVTAGVPYVRGGMFARQLVYWSVDPGRTPCLACRRHEDDLEAAKPGTSAVGGRLAEQLQRINRGIGPVASLLGSLVAMEALRYLSGFAPPVAAGAYQWVDLLTCTQTAEPWRAWPECDICAAVPARDERLSAVV
jgi:molybdopterin-synthase adenylyltransferase